MWTPPAIGIVSFIDPKKTRHKRDPGRCYIKAGWHYPPCEFCSEATVFINDRVDGVIPITFNLPKGKGCGACLDTGYAHTKGGLRVVQQFPHEMPTPEMAIGQQVRLIA